MAGTIEFNGREVEASEEPLVYSALFLVMVLLFTVMVVALSVTFLVVAAVLTVVLPISAVIEGIVYLVTGQHYLYYREVRDDGSSLLMLGYNALEENLKE